MVLLLAVGSEKTAGGTFYEWGNGLRGTRNLVTRDAEKLLKFRPTDYICSVELSD